MVVAGRDVGGERPQRVERRAGADAGLALDILPDALHRHMPGTLDHDLHILLPGQAGQLPERVELGELRRIVGVGDGARAQPVAERERHIVGAQDLADLPEARVQEILPVVR